MNEMDLLSLIETFPIDLQHIVISYDPLVIFLLSYRELVKYDWFGLIKIIFNLNYSKKVFTNEVMMKIYLGRCRKSIIKYCRENIIVKLNDGRLMGYGENYGGQFCFDDNSAMSINVFSVFGDGVRDVVEIAVDTMDATVRLSDGTLMRASIFTKRKFKKVGLKRKDIAEIVYGCGRSKFIRFSDGGIMGYVNSGYCFKRIDCGRNVADIHCGYDHCVLRLMDGAVMTCGENMYGQLGLGDRKDRDEFTEVSGLDNRDIVDIMAGYCVSVIRLVDGSIMCCGYNLNGELGFGDKKNRDVFTCVGGIPKNIDRIVFGHLHTFLLLTDGGLMGCGDNASGQLGLGDCVGKDIFTEISSVPRNIIEVYCGGLYTIIMLGDGTLLGTGHNAYGQLGLGDLKKRTAFQEIAPLPKNIVEVVAIK
ncbi:MAG: chromosome condensation regulator [Hyperionvirus sp.]|uniref:Chromosome condensation regulator n=1 Tax=Hyperionvirus sp. TaxID=2487770 RepID=A0A3G5ABU5_9VIRU|nr:MAG: chromosome condensation regulator [Hyperionvirus sp.]